MSASRCSLRAAVALALLLTLCQSVQPQTGTAASAQEIKLTIRITLEGKPYAVTAGDFYLLDADPKKLLKDGGVHLTRYLSYGEDEDEALISEFISAARASKEGRTTGGARYLAEFYEAANKVLWPHILSEASPNREGKATLRASRKGTLYVMGGVRPPQYAVWLVEVKFTGGASAIRLDSSNTMAALRDDQ